MATARPVPREAELPRAGREAGASRPEDQRTNRHTALLAQSLELRDQRTRKPTGRRRDSVIFFSDEPAVLVGASSAEEYMSTVVSKEDVHKLVDQLPAGATWDDLMREIYVRAAIENGLEDR